MVARSGQEAPAQTADMTADLAELRVAIDAIDREILALLNRRAERVREVGALKARTGAPVYVAGRERDLIGELTASNPGPFPDAGIRPVYREIISATRSLEEIVRVAFLGPEGTFCHEAAVQQFGALVDLVPANTLSDVIELCERGKAHFGVVPIENTTEGAVTECYDALVSSEVSICGELMLEVSLNLLSRAEDLSSIRRIASHPNPLGQSRGWLQRNLPGVETLETPSTTAAAQLAHNDPSVAAIGSLVSAQAYDLRVLERGIEDQSGNTTRFVIVGREVPEPTGHDLTSAVFTTRKDQSGALYRLLEPFSRFGVNLSAIQSRPIKGKPWEYLFFIDVEGHASEEAVAKALAAAGEVAQSHKLLGSFPRGESKSAARMADR